MPDPAPNRSPDAGADRSDVGPSVFDVIRCPTCDSPDQTRHPAVAFEGEVEVCRDPWHASTEAGRRALELSEASR